jgi:alkanesulfonate monooxygenase SsuD/methylene tetrahydromethanopterin reductase-like flavin-dependent oxidoreductase (luciferase family)
MEMFGVSLLEHEDRYACAEEWLTIVKRLWQDDEKFDFEGKFYCVKGGYLQPKPIQEPYPVIMNAGSSERGRRFACQHCDLVFTNIRSHDIAINTAHIAAYHKLARQTYGREVRVWGNATIVQADTDKEARDFYHYYVHEKGDWIAARNVIDTMAAEINKRDYPEERRNAMAEMMYQGADRRWACHAVQDRARRRAALLAALYRGHARIPRCDLSAAEAVGAARHALVSIVLSITINMATRS